MRWDEIQTQVTDITSLKAYKKAIVQIIEFSSELHH